jgi:repressor LexA
MFQIILKKLREREGISQKKLANKLEVAQSTVGMWESGRSNPEHETLRKIAKYFDVNIDYLVNGNQIIQTENNMIKIPVIGQISAGVPIEAIENILGYEEMTNEMAITGDFFGLLIKGNSMEPRIKQNDVLIVRKQSDVDSGDIAVVLVNGYDATVKKVMKHQDGISLISFNEAYAPTFYTYNEVETLPVEIIGKVIELRGKF